jgi:hypothetical protein
MVDGKSTAQALAAIGGASATPVSGPQAVAFETGAPNSASTSAVLAANSKISTGFGASPVFFGIGELGGGYSTGGTATQTTNVSFTEHVDLNQLATRKDLEVGLYGGTKLGTGFASMTFDLFADGVDVIHQTFTSAAAAVTFFTNNAIDVGSLASGALSGSNLTLQAVMSITTTAAGQGFYGNLIIGDPPGKTKPAALPGGLVQAIAGFGSGSGADLVAAQTHRPAMNMLAAPHLALA